MSDNVWHGDIEIGIDAARAKHDIDDLTGKVTKLRQEFKNSGASLDSFEGKLDHLNGAVGKAASGLKKLDQNVHIGASGLRELGAQAQAAERKIQKLYQTQAAGAIANGKVPQSMASWLPGSGVSEKDKNLALGGSIGADSNVIAALKAERAELDKVQAQRQKNIAAIDREKAARAQLNAEARREAEYRRVADSQGPVAEKRLREVDAINRENQARQALFKTNHQDKEASLQAQQAFSRATQARIQATNSLRTAEEQQGAAMLRSLNEQNKIRQRNQQALTTAQGRLQAEDEAQAYRKLEASVGRAEAAKRRLVTAQRAVNAAQEGMRAATGDIQAQIAATNRLADAKRRQAQAEAAARSAQGPQGNMDSTRYALYDVGATAGMGAAVGGIAVGATVKNFADIESMMATVSRTSAQTGHNMGVMETALLDMGSAIPLPLQGLTDMAARAAQLGVEGQADILAFTETMSKFAAISDTVTETEVAEYFGRLNNLTGNTKNWEEMADAVAKVGVDSAATDQQILKTSQEIAQAGAGANYSQKEIIGLAAAFASLAVPPERARSVLLDLNKIMTQGMSESTDSMKALSGQMGISEEAIRGMWRAKPTELISEMAKSLKDMEPEEVMTFLQDFGLKGARALPVFMAIAKDAKAAGDGLSVLDKAQDSVNNSAGELDRQFSITMETLAAAWQTFVNSLQAAGFDAMNDIGPILADILEGGGELLDWARNFLNTPIGEFAGNAAIGLTAFATAVLAGGAGLAIFAASMLAVKSAAASGIFGAAAAARVAAVGNSATGAGVAIAGMGRTATTSSQAVMMSTGRVQQAMDRAAGAAGRSVGTMGNKFVTAAGNVGKVGSAAVGLMGGPLGATLLIGTAVAGIATAAANAEGSYRKLGSVISEVNQQTGKSMSTVDMFDAAEQNLRANYGWMIGAQDLLTGMGGVEDPWEFNSRNAKEYLSYMKQSEKLSITTSGTAGRSTTRTLTGDQSARQGMGLQGEVTGAQFAEIGKALSKMDSASASVAFKQLSDDLGYTEKNARYLVEALGGDFSNAMWDAGTASGALSGEMGKASQNTELAGFLFSEYAGSAQAAKDAITQMNPALEEMAEGFQGAFEGMSEGAAAMNGMITAMVGGAASADQAVQALVALGVANGETGELTKGLIDLYNEETGVWTLKTAEQQAAVSAIHATAEAQVGAIANSFAYQTALVGEDQALINAQASMETARAAYVAQAEALGVSTEEAYKMADAIGLVEGSHLIIVDASSATTAKGEVDKVLESLEGLPPETKVTVNGLTQEAQDQLNALGFTTTQLDEDTTIISVSQEGAETAQAAIDQAAMDRYATIFLNYDDPGYVNPTFNYGANGGGKKPVADGGFLGGGARKPFAGGNFTGRGGKWTPAGIVHRGEYVFPKREVSQTSGVPTLDSLGRMVQQHYPQAMTPNVVVQGGGNNGPVALDTGTLHTLARLVSTRINLDGAMIAGNTNSHNRTSGRRGAN